MFQDEARFGRVSDTHRCGCSQPIRPLCQARITREYVYAYAAVSVADGELDTPILPQVNCHCRQLFLDEVASVIPMTGLSWDSMGQDGIVVTLSKLLHNLRLQMLPPYLPELNPVENFWDELREKSFHNRVFDSLDALENHLEAAMRDMEKDRECVHSIVAWPWIMNSLMK